jgi:hypothetical protein
VTIYHGAERLTKLEAIYFTTQYGKYRLIPSRVDPEKGKLIKLQRKGLFTWEDIHTNDGRLLEIPNTEKNLRIMIDKFGF